MMAAGDDGSRPLEVSILVEADPEHVWAVVSDLRRTGEWSPECRRVFILSRGPVRQGTRFVGLNRRKGLWWPTTARIHLYDERAGIGWTVTQNRARWSYRIDPDAVGTRLTERRDAPQGLSWLGRTFARYFLGGVVEHTDELEQGMGVTLQRIKAIAERS